MIVVVRGAGPRQLVGDCDTDAAHVPRHLGERAYHEDNTRPPLHFLSAATMGPPKYGGFSKYVRKTATLIFGKLVVLFFFFFFPEQPSFFWAEHNEHDAPKRLRPQPSKDASRADLQQQQQFQSTIALRSLRGNGPRKLQAAAAAMIVAMVVIAVILSSSSCGFRL